MAIALGAAGIVTGMDHAPGTPARADVTAAGDAEVTPLLDAAQADLSALAGQVEALGSQARGALAALNRSIPPRAMTRSPRATAWWPTCSPGPRRSAATWPPCRMSARRPPP